MYVCMYMRCYYSKLARTPHVRSHRTYENSAHLMSIEIIKKTNGKLFKYTVNKKNIFCNIKACYLVIFIIKIFRNQFSRGVAYTLLNYSVYITYIHTCTCKKTGQVKIYILKLMLLLQHWFLFALVLVCISFSLEWNIYILLIKNSAHTHTHGITVKLIDRFSSVIKSILELRSKSIFIGFGCFYLQTFVEHSFQQSFCNQLRVCSFSALTQGRF